MAFKRNKEYIAARDRLIPIAEAHANKIHGRSWLTNKTKNHEQWANAWNYEYHQKMNELTK